MQQPVILLSKFGAKSSHIFKQSPLNVTVVCGIDCLVFQYEFFVNNPLDGKEYDEHALNFALRLSQLFGLTDFGLSVNKLMLYLNRLT
jgi:hypothetical protein